MAEEQFRSGSIYRLIGALGRKDHCNQKFKGVSVLQRNFEFRISPGQAHSDRMGPGALLSRRFSLPLAVFGFCG